MWWGFEGKSVFENSPIKTRFLGPVVSLLDDRLFEISGKRLVREASRGL
jgi:hypothetical protein